MHATFLTINNTEKKFRQIKLKSIRIDHNRGEKNYARKKIQMKYIHTFLSPQITKQKKIK